MPARLEQKRGVLARGRRTAGEGRRPGAGRAARPGHVVKGRTPRSGSRRWSRPSRRAAASASGPSGPCASSTQCAAAAAAADAAAELMELREPEPLGVVDHHHRRRRHVDADLDHRGRDEHVELAGLERAHHAIARRSLSSRPCTRPTRTLGQRRRELASAIGRRVVPPRGSSSSSLGLDLRAHDVRALAGGDALGDELVRRGRAARARRELASRPACGRAAARRAPTTSRSPYAVSASVRGIGVAVITSRCGAPCPSPLSRSFARCATPNRCCSSITTSPSAPNPTPSASSACVPIRTSICPAASSASSDCAHALRRRRGQQLDRAAPSAAPSAARSRRAARRAARSAPSPRSAGPRARPGAPRRTRPPSCPRRRRLAAAGSSAPSRARSSPSSSIVRRCARVSVNGSARASTSSSLGVARTRRPPHPARRSRRRSAIATPSANSSPNASRRCHRLSPRFIAARSSDAMSARRRVQARERRARGSAAPAACSTRRGHAIVGARPDARARRRARRRAAAPPARPATSG